MMDTTIHGDTVWLRKGRPILEIAEKEANKEQWFSYKVHTCYCLEKESGQRQFESQFNPFQPTIVYLSFKLFLVNDGIRMDQKKKKNTFLWNTGVIFFVLIRYSDLKEYGVSRIQHLKWKILTWSLLLSFVILYLATREHNIWH